MVINGHVKEVFFFWELDSGSSTQANYCLLWNNNVNDRFHNTLPLVHNLSNINLFHESSAYGRKMNLNHWSTARAEEANMVTERRHEPKQHNIFEVGLYIHSVSQEEWTKFRESVPYVKIYWYNPKHLCQKLNGYGDNVQIKVWSSLGSTQCTCQLTVLSISVLECGVILRLTLPLNCIPSGW
jgi:hypothetical protein